MERAEHAQLFAHPQRVVKKTKDRLAKNFGGSRRQALRSFVTVSITTSSEKEEFMTVIQWLVVGVISFAHFLANALPSSYRVVELQDNWQQIFPGGETICARGEEFSFFYHPGNSDDVIIDFVGGGACWNYSSCHEDTALFVDNVDSLKERVNDKGFQGIYDHNNDSNPLKTWSHVVIPYCTGDLHWGDNVATYTKDQSSITIFHKGAVNGKTVLDWAFSEHAPQRIFVTGTSAGGYASVFWLPYIKEAAPHAKIFQFSDGAAGVVVKQAFQDALSSWNATSHAPTWIPKLDPRMVDWSTLTMVDLYTEIGRYYPEVLLSQFNTNADEVQMFFYYVMGGEDPLSWWNKAWESIATTSNNIPNFRYFHGEGEFHTIIPEEIFYTFSANNIKLVDWLQSMLDEENIGNVVCEDCEVKD